MMTIGEVNDFLIRLEAAAPKIFEVMEAAADDGYPVDRELFEILDDISLYSDALNKICIDAD